METSSPIETNQTNPIKARTATLENEDLIREIGSYLDVQLPYILSVKLARNSLKPLHTPPGHQWIISRNKDFCSSIPMAEWARSIGAFNTTEWNHSIFCLAASTGSLTVLQWAHEQYPPSGHPEAVRADVVASAAENGHIEILEYLKQMEAPVEWKTGVCSRAAAAGQLDVLKWLREELDPPCPVNGWIATDAAQNGHLHVLQWLESHFSPLWNENTCATAACNGQLHVLQWLRGREPPCPWGSNACSLAVREGRLEVLQWLRAQNPPCPWDRRECLRIAKLKNRVEVVEWILTQ